MAGADFPPLHYTRQDARIRFTTSISRNGETICMSYLNCQYTTTGALKLDRLSQGLLEPSPNRHAKYEAMTPRIDDRPVANSASRTRCFESSTKTSSSPLNPYRACEQCREELLHFFNAHNRRSTRKSIGCRRQRTRGHLSQGNSGGQTSHANAPRRLPFASRSSRLQKSFGQERDKVDQTPFSFARRPVPPPSPSHELLPHDDNQAVFVAQCNPQRLWPQ